MPNGDALPDPLAAAPNPARPARRRRGRHAPRSARPDLRRRDRLGHDLGLARDPVGGLARIPCLERGTMRATEAIDAADLALRGDGQHIVSLDAVIGTMRRIGRDMQARRRQAGPGGLAAAVPALAVNFVER